MDKKKSQEFDKRLDDLSTKYGLKKQEEPESTDLSASKGYMLGISLFSHTLIGLFIGFCVDRLTDTAPLFIIIFLFLGFIAGFRYIWKNINK
jgi:ATP synthase protein I